MDAQATVAHGKLREGHSERCNLEYSHLMSPLRPKYYTLNLEETIKLASGSSRLLNLMIRNKR